MSESKDVNGREKEKSLRLIDYLKSLTTLRSKNVYDVKDYNNLLWFDEIPKQKGCFTQAWGISEVSPEVWLEVKKRSEPSVPEYPEICEDWIDRENLYQSEEIPELKQTIPQINEVEANGELVVETEYLNLSDFPEVQEAWDKYLNEKWLSWMEEHSNWQKVHNVYTKLFEIHQEQQKLGEEYELVMGLGLLQWELPNGQEVRRHLIVAKANLDFDHKSGKFSLTSDEEGAKLDIELNMLDKFQPTESINSLKDSFEVAQDNPWDKNIIDGVLSSLANLMGEGNGEYDSGITFYNEITSKPKVYFAPALILRKRSIQSLLTTLDKIKDVIEEETDLPNWFNDLCETSTIPEDSRTEKTEDRRGENTSYDFDQDQTIYFPLPTNSQQSSIIEKLNNNDGILVKGPPGTGKSLTIANLICHLLAKNKRMLVTAKTPRALQVLHDMLPEEIKPLCVSLLGQGAKERESLQQSVGKIHLREGDWAPLISENTISNLEKSLRQQKSERAKLESHIKAIREKDTIQHVILDGTYKGTAAQIARRLSSEEAEFGWFLDEIDDQDSLAVSSEELLKFREDLIFFTPKMLGELSLKCFLTSEVPQISEVRELVSEEASLENELEETKDFIDAYSEQLLEAVNEDDIKNLLEKLNILYAETKTVLNRPYEWIGKAVSEILADRDTPWKDLEKVTKHDLKGLKERAKKIENQSLEFTVAVDRDKLIADAKRLKEYIENGGKRGWWLFKPKIIRELSYLESVSIDGEKCSSVSALSNIIEHFEVIKNIDYLWNLWKGTTNKVEGPLFLQVAHLEEVLEALSAAVELYEKMEMAKQTIQNIEGLQEPAWHLLDNVYRLICSCKTVLNRKTLEDIKSELSDLVFRMESFAKQPHTHPCILDLARAIKKRDVIEYSNLLNKFKELESLKQKWGQVEKTRERIKELFPKLLEELLKNAQDDIWDTHLRKFKDAYKWARAKDWLNNFLDSDNLPTIYTKLKKCETKISSLLSKLAAEKAWFFCLSRMTDEQSRSLKLFSKIRIPKTGKNVLRKRREAQTYLNTCKETVPAWIMPLYRVYDTVKPTQGAFDVIIIDEASQCGQEALPLFFLGKKVIVVGDDKQISPMTPGIEEELIHRLIERHLYDFKYKNTFEPKKSLFEQAFYRFSARNQISLREHFRCMPEIIRFSNDLCYSDQPLIPLKQFSSQRLTPLRCEYVPNGYREGSKSNVINRPEAESIVETIVNCCADDQYQDKTMGVIVLLGHAQDKIIESMLLKELVAEEIESRRLICGGPYSFQGDERDIIFLSMVAAPNERIQTLTNEDYVRRFNVAASRAKEQMWLFHSAQISDFGQNCLRRRLLSFFIGLQHTESTNAPQPIENFEQIRFQAYNANRNLETPPEPFDSWFEIDVFLELTNKGYRVLPQYAFADKRIDMVIEGTTGEQLAVECYGDFWHGAEQYEHDVIRQRQLERCGWKFHIIRECEFRANPQKSIGLLLKELNYRGIRPLNETKGYEGISFQLSATDKAEEGVKTEKEKAIQVNLNLGMNTCPSTIQDALRLKSKALQSTIVKVLDKRPNQSCIKDKLHTFILKELNIITRGIPRQKFARKVNQSVKQLEKNGKIETYKSKNLRVRLI